jgi:hypothetical protein
VVRPYGLITLTSSTREQPSTQYNPTAMLQHIHMHHCLTYRTPPHRILWRRRNRMAGGQPDVAAMMVGVYNSCTALVQKLTVQAAITAQQAFMAELMQKLFPGGVIQPPVQALVSPASTLSQPSPHSSLESPATRPVSASPPPDSAQSATSQSVSQASNVSSAFAGVGSPALRVYEDTPNAINPMRFKMARHQTAMGVRPKKLPTPTVSAMVQPGSPAGKKSSKSEAKSEPNEVFFGKDRLVSQVWARKIDS